MTSQLYTLNPYKLIEGLQKESELESTWNNHLVKPHFTQIHNGTIKRIGKILRAEN